MQKWQRILSNWLVAVLSWRVRWILKCWRQQGRISRDNPCSTLLYLLHPESGDITYCRNHLICCKHASSPHSFERPCRSSLNLIQSTSVSTACKHAMNSESASCHLSTCWFNCSRGLSPRCCNVSLPRRFPPSWSQPRSIIKVSTKKRWEGAGSTGRADVIGMLQ